MDLLNNFFGILTAISVPLFLAGITVFSGPEPVSAAAGNFSVVKKSTAGQTAVPKNGITGTPGSVQSSPVPVDRNKILVRFKSKPSASKIRNLISTVSGANLTGGIADTDLLVIRSEGDANQAVDRIRANPEVEIAVRMPAVRMNRIPDDEYFPLQWGPVKMNVPAGWDLFSNPALDTASVKVAVIDSGVERTHPDLIGKIDAADWVSCTDSGCSQSSSGTDQAGHGTHVAGIVAAVTDNSRGVSGIGWGVKLMSVQVLDSAGLGSLGATLNGITYAAEHGAKIINMSLGVLEGDLDDQTKSIIQQVMDNAWSKGSLLVAAAGNCGKTDNSGNPECLLGNNTYAVNPKSYPAASKNVLSVGASNLSDQLADYSGHNSASLNCRPDDSRADCWVRVTAPGGQSATGCDPNKDGVGCILSTFKGGQYAYGSGTSMAAPHVAGLAALIWAKNKNLTNGQVKQIIESTARHDILNKVSNNGLVDALSAVRAAGQPPTIPPALTVAPTLTFTPSVTRLPVTNTPAVTVPSGTSYPAIPSRPPISPFPLDEPKLKNIPPDPYPPAPYCPEQADCDRKSKGDADCDGVINRKDFAVWVGRFGDMVAPQPKDRNPNFFCRENEKNTYFIDLADFEIWRRNTSER